ncbi:hypothetical protein [Variovorax paradoxus]|uniref:hypothetical protein n=1 Tax=Variovorax paradoxus TaxID=34073 RepID=UPI00285A4525|nr:hypothetical protein [Variovorax paradoxus]MDR6453901.1 hypothetical protein [Variovorax paradoxus]
MAHYLRDKKIGSLTITEEDVRELCQVFLRRLVVNSVAAGSDQNEIKVSHFVIRFDNRGYKVYTTEDVITYWRQASKIERIIFATESIQSLNSNRANGSFVELKLDLTDENCWMVSSSDDRDWMDGSFNAVEEHLAKCKNRHGLVRTPWTPFIVYVVGQGIMLTFSLWLAVKIAPRLAVDNPVIVGFIILFFLYLPIWNFIHGQTIRLIGQAFPPVKFHKQSRSLHWFGQALVGALVIAALGQAGSWFLSLLGQLIKTTP